MIYPKSWHFILKGYLAGTERDILYAFPEVRHNGNQPEDEQGIKPLRKKTTTHQAEKSKISSTA